MGGFQDDPCMQRLAAKSRSLNQGIPLHAALGEPSHACKLVLFYPKGNQSTQLHMQEVA